VIGVANIGGQIPDSWVASLLRAMDAGLDVISGMHMRPGEIGVLLHGDVESRKSVPDPGSDLRRHSQFSTDG
jgi:hypothetical protein